MNRAVYRDVRFWLLALAFALIVAGLFLPRVKLTRDAYDTLAIVDITSSMNTHDLTLAGKPASRLDVIKDRLRYFVTNLPCQSKFGFGIFTTRRVFILFEPIETCANFASIDAAISGLNWRMAWEGDSHVTTGVHDAIATAEGLGAGLLFFTDGQESPPLHWSGMPAFSGEPGKVKGLLVGVGGKTLSPMTKYDDEGREVGTLEPDDVPQENRSGRPPPDAEQRPGYHPKWAPYGNARVDGTEHLSSVKEDHLRAIAAQTGLTYLYLDGGAPLLKAFETVAEPRAVVVATDIRPYPAALALTLLLILYGVLPLRDWLRQSKAHRIARSGQATVKLKEVSS
ncbi:MAG TPA: VWA domain-containing protein [Methyloceanibacter sp.]|nr:VWA domain-containing protein [Methyloceanibacter sp.]